MRGDLDARRAATTRGCRSPLSAPSLNGRVLGNSVSKSARAADALGVAVGRLAQFRQGGEQLAQSTASPARPAASLLFPATAGCSAVCGQDCDRGSPSSQPICAMISLSSTFGAVPSQLCSTSILPKSRRRDTHALSSRSATLGNPRVAGVAAHASLRPFSDLEFSGLPRHVSSHLHPTNRRYKILHSSR